MTRMIQTKVANTFKGKTCSKGHTERYVKSGACVMCNRLASTAAHQKRMEEKKEPTVEELGFKATVRKVYNRSQQW